MTDDDIAIAKQKYEDSKANTENLITNLLNNDVCLRVQKTEKDSKENKG